MTLHREVMSETQRALLARLGREVTPRGFYLGGGTAVALRLGHRTSVDLDWFTAADLGDPLDLLAALRRAAFEPQDVATDRGTLHASMDGIRTTFLEYRYALLREPTVWPELHCRIASLEDLACAELAAMAGRGARRDFVDVHAIARSGLSLDRQVALYGERFGIAEPGHLLRSLVYFDDAEGETMPVMLSDVSWGDIRQDLERWVKEMVGRGRR